MRAIFSTFIIALITSKSAFSCDQKYFTAIDFLTPYSKLYSSQSRVLPSLSIPNTVKEGTNSLTEALNYIDTYSINKYIDAVLNGSMPMTYYLLKDEVTALDLARNNNADVKQVERLIEAGVKHSLTYWIVQLETSSSKVEVLKQFVSSGEDLNGFRLYMNDKSLSVISFAILKKNYSLLEFAVNYGVEPITGDLISLEGYGVEDRLKISDFININQYQSAYEYQEEHRQSLLNYVEERPDFLFTHACSETKPAWSITEKQYLEALEKISEAEKNILSTLHNLNPLFAEVHYRRDLRSTLNELQVIEVAQVNDIKEFSTDNLYLVGKYRRLIVEELLNQGALETFSYTEKALNKPYLFFRLNSLAYIVQNDKAKLLSLQKHFPKIFNVTLGGKNLSYYIMLNEVPDDFKRWYLNHFPQPVSEVGLSIAEYRKMRNQTAVGSNM